MGAWSHDFFGNDGAQYLIARLAGLQTSAFHQVLEEAASDFSRFLDRDAQGLTFLALSQDELSESDRLIHDALADIPELLAQWDDSDADGHPEILTDTGNQQAQALISALVIGMHGMHEKRHQIAERCGLSCRLSNVRRIAECASGACRGAAQPPEAQGQFSIEWLGNVVKLKEMVDRL